MSPTAFPYTLPPLPPTPWRPLPPPTPWRPTPPNNSSSKGGIIAGIVVASVAAMVLYVIVTNFCKEARTSRAGAGSAAQPPRPQPEPPARRGDEQQQLGAANPTALLPAFTYSRSVKHNVTGGGEKAATCSVCLGAFHLGETVRLLPACLHLYHAECIDPWLDAHSTCPLCRSDTDPAMDDAAGRRPPV